MKCRPFCCCCHFGLPHPSRPCSAGAKKEASKKAAAGAAPPKEPEEYKGFGKR